MKRCRKRMIWPAAFMMMALGAAIAFALVWNGVILLNRPALDRYPVRGVDVSAYQGEIDWRVLSRQGIQFAFIKATEGSGFVDDRYVYNAVEARNAGLRTGAYHSSVSTVPAKRGRRIL